MSAHHPDIRACRFGSQAACKCGWKGGMWPDGPSAASLDWAGHIRQVVAGLPTVAWTPGRKGGGR